ncbi:MAG: DUF4115 domain-containing protein [Candidatus Accumulibacter sp.]|jgi:cytoskeleton protein RodZ|nr:DUF4115 domain-containing protein [Accumulibacter sp.]
MSEEIAVTDSPAGPEQGREEQASAPAEEAVDVGQRLRLAREARGISTGEAAAAIKLSPHQVEALEADDWFQFPRTITRGFVRNYARYLGIDARPLMAALDRVPMPRGPELAVGSSASVNMPREERGDWRNYVRVAAGLIAVALALLAYFFVPTELWWSSLDSVRAFVSREVASDAVEPGDVSGVIVPLDDTPLSETPSPAIVAPAPVEPVPTGPVSSGPLLAEPARAEPMPVKPLPAEPVRAEPAPAKPLLVEPAQVQAAPAVEPSSSGETLVFSFAQPSWVEVRDRDDQVILSQINPAGSRRELAGQPPFALVVGNASHVSVRYKGKAVDLSPRSKDDVARLTLE